MIDEFVRLIGRFGRSRTRRNHGILTAQPAGDLGTAVGTVPAIGTYGGPVLPTRRGVAAVVLSLAPQARGNEGAFAGERRQDSGVSTTHCQPGCPTGAH